MKLLSTYRQWRSQRTLRKLIRHGDIASFLDQLRAAHRDEQLDTVKVAILVGEALAMPGLRGMEDQWREFFESMPADVQPASFAVHHLMKRISDAAETAETEDQKRAVVKLCMSANEYTDILIGLELAEQIGNSDAVRLLHEQAGDMVASSQPAVAAPHYRKSEAADKLSHCLESLGQLWEALHHATTKNPTRLLHLMKAGYAEVAAEADAGRYLETLKHIDAPLNKARSAPDLADLRSMIEQFETRRTALVDAAQTAFREQVQAVSTGDEKNNIHSQWSHFEEQAGNLPRAAKLAHASGELERTIDLYRRAGLFASVMEVTNSAGQASDNDAWIRRAEILEEAGDWAGAAEAYDQADRTQDAVRCYESAGMPGKAAKLLAATMSEVECVNSARYIDLMKEAGMERELTGLLVRNAASLNLGAPGVHFLNTVIKENILDDATLEAARQAVYPLYRKNFDARVDRWLKGACASVDERYTRIWGLDLGTTNSIAMIYNKDERKPEPCIWKGKTYFPSTLALDDRGVEVVGVTPEEALAEKFLGIVSSSKRRMGHYHVYEIGGRKYRPESVAAKIVAHGRAVVERFLGEEVAKEVRARVQKEFAHFREDWLEEKLGAEFRPLQRPDAFVTIPAYFNLKQKKATRQACEIAGLKVERMLHEPTAACLGVNLQGHAIVVDVGAGTTDLSAIDISRIDSERQLVVLHVSGDNELGGNDFDEAVYQRLVKQVEAASGTTPKSTDGLTSRLRIASERIKIDLSHAEHATYYLHGLPGGRPITLQMTRAELVRALAPCLARLNEICRQFNILLSKKDFEPKHLLLVGGSLLAPHLRKAIEEVFGLRAVGFRHADPRTAVANGAAIHGAVLVGDIEDMLLLDVVPQALGIAAISDGSNHEQFATLLDKDTTIPTTASKVFSTNEDNQGSVNVRVYQGGTLNADAMIGVVTLDQIPPAPRGEPKIEVTFDIDASCVLSVSALDKGTGRRRAIEIEDTHLLGPDERDKLKRLFEKSLESEKLLRELDTVRDAIGAALSAFERMKLAERLTSWRDARDSLRVPAQGFPTSLDATLKEMYRDATAVETDVSTQLDLWRDLSVNARQLLDSDVPRIGDDRAINEDLHAILESARDLHGRLDGLVSKARDSSAKLDTWNVALLEAREASADAAERIEIAHRRADHDAVIAIYDGTDDKMSDAVTERYLDSFAHTRKIEEYKLRVSKLAEQGRIRSTPISNWNALDEWCKLVRPAVAFVECRSTGAGSGFLVAPDLIVTNRHVILHEGETVPAQTLIVHVNGRRRGVRAIQTGKPDIDIAVLELDKPAQATPFRCGRGSMVEVGSRVVGMGFPRPRPDQKPEDNFTFLEGLVQRILRQKDREQVLLFQIDLELREGISGGPLVNQFGEVIGLLTMSQSPEGGEHLPDFFAVPIDPLSDLIRPPWDRR